MNAETIIRELLKFYFSEFFADSKPNWDFTCCSRHEQRVIGSQENLDLIKNWIENKKNNSISESIQDDLICLLDSQFGEVYYVDEVKTMACQIVVDRFKGVGEEV
jgi:hypothetical protein